MARRKTKRSKPKKDTYAIIVDGETEVWNFGLYFILNKLQNISIDVQMQRNN